MIYLIQKARCFCLNIDLYINASQPNVLNKSIGEPVLTITNARCIDSTNMVNPVIILSTATIPANVNYVRIQSFHRYYFITSASLESGNVLRLSLHVDVLMSFKTSINSSTVLAYRSTAQPNVWLPDNEMPLETKKKVIYRNFGDTPSFFGSDKTTASSKSFLLTVLNSTVVNMTLTIKVSGSQVDLDWNTVSGAQNYSIERRKDNGSWVVIATRTYALYTDKVTTPGVYYYRVRAKLSSGDYSDYSNVASANIASIPTINLILDSIDGLNINLSWTLLSNVSTYTLERSADQSTWNVEATTTEHFVEDRVQEAGTYYYRVYATFVSGDKSSYSNVLTVEVAG